MKTKYKSPVLNVGSLPNPERCKRKNKTTLQQTKNGNKNTATYGTFEMGKVGTKQFKDKK